MGCGAGFYGQRYKKNRPEKAVQRLEEKFLVAKDLMLTQSERMANSELDVIGVALDLA